MTSPNNFIDVTSRAPGRIEFVVRTPTGDGVWNVMICRTNAANYVRNIRVMRREFESNYLSDPWNPDSVAKIVDRFNTRRWQ